MVEVGRDLWRSSSPSPCSSRVTFPRIVCRWLLNISKEGDATTSVGNVFQSSVTLSVKKFLHMFRQTFLCFDLCPLPECLLLGRNSVLKRPELPILQPSPGERNTRRRGKGLKSLHQGRSREQQPSWGESSLSKCAPAAAAGVKRL